MKVAITGTGKNLDSKLDPRFGRCNCFFIYDTESGGIEVISNPNKEGREDVGPVSVQLISSLEVAKVVSGEFGIKIKSLFDNLKIQLIILKDPEITVKEIVEMLQKNTS